MAEKLLKYYGYIESKKGPIGRMQLAQKTRIPSNFVNNVTDSNENIEKFRKAVEEITGESAPNY